MVGCKVSYELFFFNLVGTDDLVEQSWSFISLTKKHSYIAIDEIEWHACYILFLTPNNKSQV